ncbi:hypothetical protein BDZ97DRAFT_1435215 [Flammula alnicola]|nr:hypothetical protein BDZ97DRAFT_1435215 [Flammula alnicola]
MPTPEPDVDIEFLLYCVQRYGELLRDITARYNRFENFATGEIQALRANNEKLQRELSIMRGTEAEEVDM